MNHIFHRHHRVLVDDELLCGRSCHHTCLNHFRHAFLNAVKQHERLTTFLTMKLIGRRIRRIPSFSNLCKWWKSRRFKYVVHINLSDDSVAKELRGKSGKDSEEATSDLKKPLADSETREKSELILKSSLAVFFK